MSKTVLAFIGMLMVVCSCQQEQDAGMSNADMEKVLEARVYFENDKVSSMPADGRQVRLYPGILSPNWSKAKVVETETSVITSVPFDAQFWFKAKRKRLDKSGEIADYTVKAWQKFIIIKDKETEKFGGYFVTLIPDKAYYKDNKNFKVESYAAYGNRLNFSGKEVYTTMTDGKIVSVNIIQNGEQVASASLACPEEKFASNANKISKALNGIVFIQRTHAITRGIEDDNWLDEVVITPDDPYDWGNDDDWWRDAHPPYEPDDDYGDDYDWGNDDNNEPDNDNPGNNNEIVDEDKRNLDKALEEIKLLLKDLGIDTDAYKIELNVEVCISSARTLPDGTIEVCSKFFSYDSEDQSSIIWHEIYHITHDHNNESELIKLEKENYIHLVPDEIASMNLDTFLNWYYEGLAESFIKDIRDDMLVQAEIRSAQWYENEIETYKAELNNGLDKSEHYQAELEYLLWKHEEMLKRARN